MLAKIAAFEFRYQVKSPLFLATFVVFFLLAFGAMSSDNIQIGAIGSVNVNSPHALAQITLVFSLIAMFVITAFLATVVVREFEWRTADIFRATPARARDLLLGRFAGGFAVSLLLLSAAPLGTWLGTLTPWPDPERLGPLVFAHYAWPFLIFGVVNLFFLGALAFAFATLTRSMGMTYVAVIGFFFIYGVAQSLFNLEAHRDLAALLDPFGNSAYLLLTRYWTPVELNAEMVPLSGMVLWNRVLWLAIASTILAFTVVRYRFEPSKRRERKRHQAEDIATLPVPQAVPIPTLSTGAAMAWRQFARRTCFEVRRIVFGAPFIVLASVALIMTISSFPTLSQIYGTDVWPVTRLMIQVMQGTFILSLMIITVWVGADLVWRERDAGIHEVIDATPVPGWVFSGSKILAALTAVAILLATGILGALGWQLWKGYTNVEWGLYLTRYLLDFGRLFYVMAVTSVFVQTLVANKYAGMGVMMLVIISFFVLDPLGFEDPLYQIGARADIGYSDMNGWGQFATIALSYAAYWGFFCVLLFVGVHLLWPRGGTEPLRLRLRRAPANLSPAIAGTGALALAGFLGMGGFIFYNTHVLNEYVTEDDTEQRAVLYEERYMAREDLPQPRITAIEANVDLYTDERRYRARGSYRLENRTDGPIETVHVGFNPDIEVRSVSLDGLVPAETDETFNYYSFDLAAPMAPGASLPLSFETALAVRGFKHDGNAEGALGGGGVTLVANGSLVYGAAILPYIGFSRNFIITDRNERRRRGLPEIDRAADLEDMAAARDSYLRQDSDWLDFRTTVSTNIEEHVVAPGRPIREWTEGERRYVTYEMSAPIQNLIAWLSADYERRKAQWNDVDVEIFYDRAHPYNIDKMVETVKASLDYFSENFSPYQYEQMRILEFPAFLGGFAQSFANTILWSEGLGFIARLEDPSEIDYVFYVGAHEMAHQWWGHQVSSANVQGQTVLVETLAQYSALMVMEREYGPHLMRRFLKFELDSYLSGRGSESREELPLHRVENQPYIHYRKGSVVMYALKDYLGEERINRALAGLIEDVAYQYAPYPRSVDLLRHLEAVAETEDERKLIEDLFERITLWDLKAEEATVTERADGRFDVEIAISAKKLEADGEGREEEVPLDMPIDIGVFIKNPEDADFGEDAVLHLEKHRVRNGETTLTLTVDERPAFAGVDPYAKLIDRNTGDNLIAVGR